MKRSLKLFFGIFTAAVALWALRRALPLFAPFIPALGLAVLMEPWVGGMCRRGVRRSIAAGLVTAVVLGLCLSLVVLGAAGGARLVTAYAKKAPDLLIILTDTADSLRQAMNTAISTVPRDAALQLNTMLDSMTAQLSSLPVRVSEQALEGMAELAKTSPDKLLFLCTAVIGVYFFSLYLRDMEDFFRRQLSEGALQRLELIRSVLRSAAGGYLKVQCILSGVTFLILLAAFGLMEIESPVPAAAAIAVIDALPILGAGAVLLPWALFALVLGKAPRGLVLLSVYGILLVVRNLLQARLMGSRLGLHPLAALVSLYAGWQLGGLWGMIAVPAAVVVISSLNNANIIRLYR